MQFYHENRKPPGTIEYLCECLTTQRKGRERLASPHVHEYFELLLGTSGCCALEIDGRTVPFGAGDMVVIDPMTIHSAYGMDDGENRYMVLKFVPELMHGAERLTAEMSSLLAYYQLRSTHRCFYPAEYVERSGIRTIFEHIFTEYREREFGYALSIRAEVLRLFVIILRDWRRELAPELPDAKSILQLQRAYEFIEAHYGEDIRLSDAAQHCGMAYSSFSRFFSSHAGRSFTDMLMMTRVKKSMQMLDSTDMSVTDIAARTGFSSTSHYIRCFKAITGKTPLKYRESASAGGAV